MSNGEQQVRRAVQLLIREAGASDAVRIADIEHHKRHFRVMLEGVESGRRGYLTMSHGTKARRSMAQSMKRSNIQTILMVAGLRSPGRFRPNMAEATG